MFWLRTFNRDEATDPASTISDPNWDRSDVSFEATKLLKTQVRDLFGGGGLQQTRKSTFRWHSPIVLLFGLEDTWFWSNLLRSCELCALLWGHKSDELYHCQHQDCVFHLPLGHMDTCTSKRFSPVGVNTYQLAGKITARGNKLGSGPLQSCCGLNERDLSSEVSDCAISLTNPRWVWMSRLWHAARGALGLHGVHNKNSPVIVWKWRENRPGAWFSFSKSLTHPIWMTLYRLFCSLNLTGNHDELWTSCSPDASNPCRSVHSSHTRRKGRVAYLSDHVIVIVVVIVMDIPGPP